MSLVFVDVLLVLLVGESFFWFVFVCWLFGVWRIDEGS